MLASPADRDLCWTFWVSGSGNLHMVSAHSFHGAGQQGSRHTCSRLATLAARRTFLIALRQKLELPGTEGACRD